MGIEIVNTEATTWTKLGHKYACTHGRTDGRTEEQTQTNNMSLFGRGLNMKDNKSYFLLTGISNILSEGNVFHF